jgi:hypothetical protein
MPDLTAQYAAIKRKIRMLKKLEIKIRFGGLYPAGRPEKAELVWDAFFDLREGSDGSSRYSLPSLAAMDKEEYQSVMAEFFWRIYYRYYQENGIGIGALRDPDSLAWLSLPPDADDRAIKKKFRELALKHHPDTGGDAASFIELVDQYRKLIEKGR